MRILELLPFQFTKAIKSMPSHVGETITSLHVVIIIFSSWPYFLAVSIFYERVGFLPNSRQSCFIYPN